MKTKGEDGHLHVKKKGLEETNPIHILISDCLNYEKIHFYELREKTLLLLKPTSPWYFVMAALAK